MGILFVQSNNNVYSSGTTITATFNSANTAGNLIVVGVSHQGGVANNSVTDQAGNQYVSAILLDNATEAERVEIFYAKKIASRAAGNVVTVNMASTVGDGRMHILEVSGCDTMAPLDQKASGQGTSAAPSAGPVTTIKASELLFGCAVGDAGNLAAGSGWTTLGRTSDNFGVCEYQIVTAIGSYTATWTQTSANWTAAIATFIGASGLLRAKPQPRGF